MNKKVCILIFAMISLVAISAVGAEEICSNQINQAGDIAEVGISDAYEDIYVSSNGTGDGKSVDNPMKFTNSIGSLDEYSNIKLLDGNYSTTISFHNNNTIVSALNPGKVILSESIVIMCSNFTFKDIIFTKDVVVYTTDSTSVENLTFSNCAFIDGGAGLNSPLQIDGTLDAFQNVKNVLVENCTFINCSSTDGGAIDAKCVDNLFITNCTFINNTALSLAGQGGAIRMYRCGNVYVSNSTFINNTAKYFHGGAINAEAEYFACENSIFINNTGMDGGAINIESAPIFNNPEYQAYRVHEVLNCTFINNSVYREADAIYNDPAYGGAIHVEDYAHIERSTFINNTAQDLGGAVFFTHHDSYSTFENNTDYVKDCTFIGNSAKTCGALYWWADAGYTNNCTFINNTATNSGGALVIYKESENTVVSNCTFENNSAKNGGAIYLYAAPNTSVDNCTFKDNGASASGGAIYSLGIEGIINDCTFTDNEGNWGGSIYLHGKNNQVNNSDFERNSATVSGGSMYMAGTANVVNNSNFKNNSAVSGGAIITKSANSIINNSNFTDNKGSDLGGAIFTECSYSTISNSEFTNNYCGWGGAIEYSNNDGVISNCTFIANAADAENGGYGGAIDFEKVGKIENSIFIDNVAAEHSTIFNYGEMYLSNNTIEGEYAQIYNDGIITSPVTLTVLDNRTVGVLVGETIDITSVLTDDNGNRIINGTLKNEIEGQNKTCDFDEYGVYSTQYTVVNTGLIPVKGDYLEATDLTVKNGALYSVPAPTEDNKGESKISIEINDTYYADSFVIEVNLTGVLDRPLSGTVTVTIDGKDYEVEVVDGKGNKTVNDLLDADAYEATATYAGSEIYNATDATTNFNVLPIDTEVNISVSNSSYGDSNVVNVTLTDVKGRALSDNVTVTVDGRDYSVEVVDGKGSVILDETLPAGTYEAKVAFDGTENYNPSENTTGFNVLPIDTVVTISVSNSSYGDSNVVNVTLTDVKGNVLSDNVTVTVDGRDYSVEVVDGKGSVVLDETLPIGSYEAKVAFDGTENYNPSENTTLFDVAEIIGGWITNVPDKSVVTTNETVTFLITVGNNGSDTRNFTVKDVFDNSAYEFISANSSQGNYSLENGTWKIGELEVDKQASLKITVKALTNLTVTLAAKLTIEDTDFIEYANATVEVENPPVNPKEEAKISIKINDTSYNDSFVIEVNLTGVSDSPLSGTVNVTIDGKIYEVEVVDGKGNKTVNDLLDVDAYEATATYAGSEIYNATETATNFNVIPLDTKTTITVSNSSYGDPNIVNVTLTDVKGRVLNENVTVTIDGKFYPVEIVAGKGSIVLDEKIPAGTYEAKVAFNGTKNYNPSANTTLFDVDEIIGGWITNVPDKSLVETNETLTFTITVGNNGSNVRNFTVDDMFDNSAYEFISANSSQGNYSLETGIWKIGELEADKQATLTITVKVLTNSTVTNVAKLTIDETDFIEYANATVKVENPTLDIDNPPEPSDENQNSTEENAAIGNDSYEYGPSSLSKNTNELAKTGNPIVALLLVLLTIPFLRRKH